MLLNSKIVGVITSAVNPTLTLQSGDVACIPVKIGYKQRVEELVAQNISISQDDWDAYEISWDFRRHPLIVDRRDYEDQMILGFNAKARRESVSLIARRYELWKKECEERYQNLKHNEEELNQIFIDIYGLSNELTPEVDDKDITVRQADLRREVRSFISYAVGYIFQ